MIVKTTTQITLRKNSLDSNREGANTFKEITYAVGYEDISFFRKIFVRLTGMRPREYQKKLTGYSVQP